MAPTCLFISWLKAATGISYHIGAGRDFILTSFLVNCTVTQSGHFQDGERQADSFLTEQSGDSCEVLSLCCNAGKSPMRSPAEQHLVLSSRGSVTLGVFGELGSFLARFVFSPRP